MMEPHTSLDGDEFDKLNFVKINYRLYLMPDLFDSFQATLHCCPFLWPTAGLVEAAYSFSSTLFPGFTNLFIEHWSWYRYCSKYPYRFICQNWFFCPKSWLHLYLSISGTQQESGDISQKVSSLMMKLWRAI